MNSSNAFMLLLINCVETIDMDNVNINDVANSLFKIHLSDCSKLERQEILNRTKQRLNRVTLGFQQTAESLESNLKLIDEHESALHKGCKRMLGVSTEQDSRVVEFAKSLKKDWYNNTSAGTILGISRNTVGKRIKKGLIQTDGEGYNNISKEALIEYYEYYLNKQC